MSAATAQACIICQSSSSKYKCPSCRGATCSLGCSKQHVALRHPAPTSQGSAEVGPSSHSSIPVLPSLQLRNEKLDAPSSSRFNKVGRYVAMKEYDSQQLMEDFDYLQYVGKAVTMLGKDIVKSGWMREVEQKGSGSGHDKGNSNGAVQQQRAPGKGFHHHLPAEVKNRQTFEGWIRKLRLPIMLVPDGMSWRKENQTRWKNNTKQLLCSVEVRFAPHSSTSRSLIHHIPWDKSVAEVATREVERSSKQKGKMTESSSDTSSFVNRALGRRMDEDKDWKGSTSIAVSISNDRLRNESTSKFLEWWQRQVKNGMVKADGLRLDEEKRRALEQLRSGAWGTIEGMGGEEGEWKGLQTEEGAPLQVEHVEEKQGQTRDEMPSSNGLISLALLGKMQAAREKKVEPSKTDEAQGVPSRSKVKAVSQRTLVLVDDNDTFQDVLRQMPKGFAAVEYFHIEVWDRQTLLTEMDRGHVVQVKLAGKETREQDWKVEPVKRGREGKEEEEEGGAGGPTKKAKSGVVQSDALGGLAAYASSEEEEEEERGGKETEDEEEEERGGKETEDEEERDDLQSSAEEAEPGSANSMASGGGGLAEIARTLGMVPV